MTVLQPILYRLDMQPQYEIQLNVSFMIYKINYQTNTTMDTVLLFRRMSREDQALSLLHCFSFIAKTKVKTFQSLEIKSIQKTLTPKSKQLYLKNESLMKHKSGWNKK